MYPKENEKANNIEQMSKAINVPKGYSIITKISNLRSFRLSSKLFVALGKIIFARLWLQSDNVG